jgi:hypothetical protein
MDKPLVIDLISSSDDESDSRPREPVVVDLTVDDDEETSRRTQRSSKNKSTPLASKRRRLGSNATNKTKDGSDIALSSSEGPRNFRRTTLTEPTTTLSESTRRTRKSSEANAGKSSSVLVASSSAQFAKPNRSASQKSQKSIPSSEKKSSPSKVELSQTPPRSSAVEPPPSPEDHIRLTCTICLDKMQDIASKPISSKCQ